MSTAPNPVGLCRNERHEYFWEGAGPLVSITTAMGSIHKPAIGPWMKKLTAEAAIRNLDILTRMTAEGGEQAGVEFLKKLADYKRQKAADLGTRVHILAEAIARKQDVEITDEERPYLNAYLRFLEEWQPEFTAAEYMVCSLKHGYAGTGDSVILVSGDVARQRFACLHKQCRIRLDTKTSAEGKGPYAETGLQLAAANYAEFSGRPGDPKKYRVPAADHHGVLQLTGAGMYAVVPYDVTPREFNAFLAAKHLWEWLQGPAQTVVGQITEKGVIAA